MGFGTLFIGYFFLVNISYFEYTDIISSMVMLLGLYNLSRFNRGFKMGFFFTSAFALFSFTELAFVILDLFGITSIGEDFAMIFSIPRYLLIFALTVSLLIGIKDIACEVEAYDLSKKASSVIPFTSAYVIMAICDIPMTSNLLGVAMPYVYTALLIMHLVIVTTVLITVYKAYSTICMPDDLEVKTKKSRFAFINKFREREEKKNREYADYKIKKGIDAKNKKSNSKKK